MPLRREGVEKRNKKVNKAVGAFVKHIRKEKGLSQIAMARLLDLEQTTLSRVEAGQRELGVKSWFLLWERCCTKPSKWDVAEELFKHVLKICDHNICDLKTKK